MGRSNLGMAVLMPYWTLPPQLADELCGGEYAVPAPDRFNSPSKMGDSPSYSTWDVWIWSNFAL